MTQEEMLHELVPTHEKITDQEKQDLLDRYHVSLLEMPKIRVDDSAIAHLDAKRGDIIKITRPSFTAGHAHYYRVVVNA